MFSKDIQRSIRNTEEKIDYTFTDKKLLITALTHTSYINEAKQRVDSTLEDYLGHNERLEFLGDSVLEIIVTDELFTRFPDKREGELTSKRSNLVSNKRLAEMAEKIKLQDLLRLGKGEESQKGRNNSDILADCFEALLGAMYIDARNAGVQDPLKPVRDLIRNLFASLWESAPTKKISKDNKTLLQERTQSIFKAAPKYSLISIKGDGHKQTFSIELQLPTGEVLKQQGASKRIAEQKAAERALKMIESHEAVNL